MIRRSRFPGVLIVGMIMISIIAAIAALYGLAFQGGPGQQRSAPVVRPALVPLPDGGLQVFTEADTALHFLVLDSVRRDGDRVTALQYTAIDPGSPSGNRIISHWVSEVQVNCTPRTGAMKRLSAYDEAGSEVLWLPTDPVGPLTPNSSLGHIAVVLCDSPQVDSSLQQQGWREALAFARERLRTR